MEEGTAERVVCFWLGPQQFGAPIEYVNETIMLRPVTRVFLAPPWLAGIINLRGDVVAVVDLSSFFSLGRCTMGTDARIVIAHSGGPQRKRAGFLVDRLAEVKPVPMQALQATSTLSPEQTALTHGVLTQDGGAPLTVLDVPKLFESERLRQFQRKA